MDRRLRFSRTEKGRLELIGTERALIPKQRRVLFMVSDHVSVDTLMEQLPNCADLEDILQQLWDEGYIELDNPGSVDSHYDRLKDALAVLGTSRLDAARVYAMDYLAPIIGMQSPAFQRLRAATDREGFTSAVAECKRLVAAVASTSKAQAFEAGVMNILSLPPAVEPREGSLERARQRALEIIATYIGENSPAYLKLRDATSREAFVEAVRISRGILAAAASASKAAAFEHEVLSLLGN